MKILKPLFAVSLVILSLSSCNLRNNSINERDALAAHIDSSVKPGDDFFLYANGKWFKENPIPSTEKQNGLWQLIQDTINEQIRHICITSMELANAEKGSNKQKIGDFFYSGMDSVSINKIGINALKEDIDKIENIKDLNGIINSAAYIHKVSASPLFSFYVNRGGRVEF